jgi:hypothetical protein
MDTRIVNAGQFSEQANRQFLSEGREIFAWLDPAEVQKAMLAMIQLHFRGEIAHSEPSVDLYLSIQKRAFLVLLERGAIKFAGGEPGSLAQKTIADWRRETGIGSASLPAPLPPAKTSEELYAEQIISDWNTLSSDQFKARLASDRKYRETFRQLSETDRITVRAQKPKSDEQLEQEVIADYRHLPGKEFQAKRRNSAAYDAMYVKLANENRISL